MRGGRSPFLRASAPVAKAAEFISHKSQGTQSLGNLLHGGGLEYGYAQNASLGGQTYYVSTNTMPATYTNCAVAMNVKGAQ